MNNISLADLRAFKVPVPTRGEQNEILRRVKELVTLATAVEQRVAAAATRTDKSAKAILAKAVRGDLGADRSRACPR